MCTNSILLKRMWDQSHIAMVYVKFDTTSYGKLSRIAEKSVNGSNYMGQPNLPHHTF